MYHKKYKHFLFLGSLVFLVLFSASCAKPQSKKVKANIKIKNTFSISQVPAGGMMLYLHHQEGNKIQALHVNNPNFTMTLPNGNWKFHLMSFDGANPISGNIRCAYSENILNGENTTVTLNLAENNCNRELVAPINFRNATGGIKNLKIVNCLRVDNITTDGQNCDGTYKGTAQSIKIKFSSYLPMLTQNLDSFKSNTNAGLNSTCIPLSTSTNSVTDLQTKFPLGDNNSALATSIKTFESADCSGQFKEFHFPKGLAAGSSTFPNHQYLNGTTSADNFLYLRTGTQSANLSARYPTNGASWLDLIVGSWSDRLTSSDTPCVIASSPSCFHAGELKKMTLTGYSSCADLIVEDDLDAFDWSCELVAGTATIYSLGLKYDKKLAHLINSDGASWKNNFVRVYKNNDLIFINSNGNWWPSNTFININSLGSLSTTLPQSGTYYVGYNNAATTSTGTMTGIELSHAEPSAVIYTVTSNISVPGLNLFTDKSALVVFPGYTLNSSHNTSTYNFNAGAYFGNIIDSLIASSSSQLWLEGSFNGGSISNRHIFYGNFNKFVTFRHFHAENAGTGINLGGSPTNNNLIIDSSFDNLTSAGVKLENNVASEVTHNYFSTSNIGVHLALTSNNNFIKHNLFENNKKGVYLNGVNVHSNRIRKNTFTKNTDAPATPAGGILSELSVKNIIEGNNFYGNCQNNSMCGSIYLKNASNENFVLSNLMVNENGAGIFLDGSLKNTFQNNSIINSSGIYLYSSSSNIFINNISSNNSDYGVYLTISSSNRFINSYFTNNSRGVLIDSSSDNNSFEKNVVVSTNSVKNCDESGSTGNNLSGNGACTYSGGASGTYINNIDLTNSFTGIVSSDPNNLHQNLISSGSGFVNYASISDWQNFSSPFYTWGKGENSNPISTLNQNGCHSGTCALWDWRIDQLDTQIKNTHGVFTSGITCPTTVNGLKSITDTRATAITHLYNAIENLDAYDAQNNYNGLCEANETCIYSPNPGAYQGHGVENTCTFDPAGGLAGIAINGYETNGVQ